MIFFRRLKKQTLLFWIFLSLITLLGAQSITLHIHTLGHAHNHELQSEHGLGNSLELVTQHSDKQSQIEHSHVSAPHLSNDSVHGSHDNQIVYEVDLSPDGVLKKVSNLVLNIIFLAAFLILILAEFSKPVFRYFRKTKLLLAWRYVLSPPLRAPPSQ